LAYKIEWHEGALKDLDGLNREIARKIVERVKKYLAEDPLKIGKPLKGQFSGLWKYRYGDYRVIYVLDLEAMSIKILKVRHRKNVYKE
jgi:mRNA interferase RelE/StbE